MGEKRVHKNQGPLLRLLHFHLYGATTANERRRLKTKAHITRAPRVVYRYKARFFFLPKGRSVNPLEATTERRRWLDARDDIFMYIYTIATKTMGRYILHIAFFFGGGLEWRIGLLLGWDKTFRMLKIPPPSAACWCWRVLSPFLPFASVSGEWNGIAQRYRVSQQAWDVMYKQSTQTYSGSVFHNLHHVASFRNIASLSIKKNATIQNLFGHYVQNKTFHVALLKTKSILQCRSLISTFVLWEKKTMIVPQIKWLLWWYEKKRNDSFFR